MGTTNPQLRPPWPDEGERLRELMIASKAHWGYDLDRVRQWATAGDFSPEAMRSREIWVAEVDSRPVGWAALIPRGEVCWLDDLWVAPAWMGQGIGAALFNQAAERGKKLGAKRMEWEAERHALGFYEKLGGRYLRESEPGSWGRRSPIYGLDLDSG